MEQSNIDSGVFDSRTDRERSLAALHQVEAMAAGPAPLRLEEWRDDLLAVLPELSASLTDQHARTFLDEIAAESPHLASSVGDLRNRQAQLLEKIDQIQADLGDMARPVEYARLRELVSEIATDVRELRAWETDLVYEAFSVDLGVGD